MAGVRVGLSLAKTEEFGKLSGVRAGLRAVIERAAEQARLVMTRRNRGRGRNRPARLDQEQGRDEADHERVTGRHATCL